MSFQFSMFTFPIKGLCFPCLFIMTPRIKMSSYINRHLLTHNFSFKTSQLSQLSFFFLSTVHLHHQHHLHLYLHHSLHFIFPNHFHTFAITIHIMVGSSETNPNPSNPNPSSAKSGKRKGKQVQFAEEPTSSKRQRVQEEDDMSIYRSGPLEPISPAFEHRNHI